MMKRFTRYSDVYGSYIIDGNKSKVYSHQNVYGGDAVDRLAELEDKIEQGTLIELPILDIDILEDYAHRMFDSWNDTTGAIHNGCSWYGEVLSVIDDIGGMVYGITKRQSELKELQE
jgi:hypothetical protein